jgi:TRAP transporter TAXI family solute receptor
MRTRWFYLTAGVLTVVALVAAAMLRDPLPPKTVVMTTGTPGSAYEAFAQEYKRILARSDVELRLMPSAGAVENLHRLNDPRSGVSVGFARGGLTDEKQSPDLLSLGTLFYEPLWLFYRGIIVRFPLTALHGRKLSVGPEGSTTRVLALQILALNGIDGNVTQLLPLSPAESAAALQRRKIDAAMMIASWDTAAVRQLLASPEIELASFQRADAYVALYPFLTKLTLPAGVGNVAANRPPASVNLIAPTTSLIVRKDLHPAIQHLLLDAVLEIHSAAGIFHKAGRFPAPEQGDVPVSTYAYEFYKSGQPFLMRSLPFWLAALLSSWLVVLIPVVGIAYPLLRLAPAVYSWSMRRRIFGLYGELKFIEVEIEAHGGHVTKDLREGLDRLEERANHLRIPVDYAHFLYALRMHIDLVRTRLQQSPEEDVPRDSRDIESSAPGRRPS